LGRVSIEEIGYDKKLCEMGVKYGATVFVGSRCD
jgi:hypothetical protein